MQAQVLNLLGRVDENIELPNEFIGTTYVDGSNFPIYLVTKGSAKLAVPFIHEIGDILDINYTFNYTVDKTKVVLYSMDKRLDRFYLVTKNSYCEFIIS